MSDERKTITVHVDRYEGVKNRDAAIRAAKPKARRYLSPYIGNRAHDWRVEEVTRERGVFTVTFSYAVH